MANENNNVKEPLVSKFAYKNFQVINDKLKK